MATVPTTFGAVDAADPEDVAVGEEGASPEESEPPPPHAESSRTPARGAAYAARRGSLMPRT
ncbi:hypothetical protein GCM10011519_11620 [Marmoricola endophyticus]|uniref:Uncharacterized protein n=1 Tax=Marmoricola endophyticus TaxID=2040280 RepID=A0A917F2X7_9ACTN|nr:hypothetical protein GCM10011519_11620 [Marmoricola endophyticus]